MGAKVPNPLPENMPEPNVRVPATPAPPPKKYPPPASAIMTVADGTRMPGGAWRTPTNTPPMRRFKIIGVVATTGASIKMITAAADEKQAARNAELSGVCVSNISEETGNDAPPINTSPQDPTQPSPVVPGQYHGLTFAAVIIGIMAGIAAIVAVASIGYAAISAMYTGFAASVLMGASAACLALRDIARAVYAGRKL